MKRTNKTEQVLDRGAAVPLYHQIFLQLRDEILSGLRVFGTSVPTEQELSGSYGVSRITARRALDELAEQHFVSRKRRVGTTVIFKLPAKPIVANINQAVESLLELGRATKVKVLLVRREIVSPSIAEALQLKSGAQVVRAVRVRHLDGEPLGYVVSYVRDELRRAVTRRGLQSTPILGLIRRAGHRLGRSTQTIAATLADPVICKALQIEPRAAILRISRTVCDHAGRPLLVTFAHYRSDRYQLRLDLHA